MAQPWAGSRSAARRSLPHLPPCRLLAVLSPAPPGCPERARGAEDLLRQSRSTLPFPSEGKLLGRRPLPFGGLCSSSACCVCSPSSSGGSRTPPPNSGAPRGPCRPGPAAGSAPAGQGCRRDPETEPESADLSPSGAAARRKYPKSGASRSP